MVGWPIATVEINPHEEIYWRMTPLLVLTTQISSRAIGNEGNTFPPIPIVIRLVKPN